MQGGLNGDGGRNVPLLFPRMSLNTPFRPKRFRKYHDSALSGQQWFAACGWFR